MERIYYIDGLDCANCAAKLERHLKEISYFDTVIINFMAQKLIVSAQDEEQMQKGLREAQRIIDRVEPGVVIAEKKKKDHVIRTHIHDEHCSCGHHHEENDGVHNYGGHHHGEHCSCGHNHHEGNNELHDHAEHHHDEHCSCGNDYHEENDELCSHAEYQCERIFSEVESEQIIQSTEKKANYLNKEMKESLLKISISAILFALAVFLQVPFTVQFSIFLLAYLIIGGEVLLRATKNIMHGQIFDENFLMTIATIGAFCVGEYPEAVMVMLLYQLGELFQNYAVQRSRRSIADLMDIKPEIAHVKEGASFTAMAPEDVIVGDVIQIRPGERVPLDGIVLEGNSALNTVALTGESLPREVTVGDVVMSGCINESGVLLVRVEKEYENSTVAKILDLVENASSKKAETENFITRFARYYTPIVVAIAAILAIIPPLVLQAPFESWVYRALVFLVISCPCALVISIPLTFFSGLGVCSRYGILVKGSNYLESLAHLETAVFDKTGTLTKGQFSVTEVYLEKTEEAELFYYAACAESISNHPIAQAIQKANQLQIKSGALQHAEEVAGCGISAIVDGRSVLVGNYRLMKENNISCVQAEREDTIVYVAIDDVFCGWIAIADEIKADAKSMVAQLKALGIHNIVMLTGDRPESAEKVAKQLGITSVFAKLLPGDKVRLVEQILEQKNEKTTVGFTGDGLNDAPVLARSDVGIAMGGLGSDAAIEAADVVIMDDQLGKLADAVQIARKTCAIARQNIVFVLTVKLIVLLLGALGMATMWMAVFADVGVAFLAILNALRIMKY